MHLLGMLKLDERRKESCASFCIHRQAELNRRFSSSSFSPLSPSLLSTLSSHLWTQEGQLRPPQAAETIMYRTT